MNILNYYRAKVFTTARALGADEEGATAAEYAFLLVFIAIVATIGMVVLGQGLLNIFDETGTTIDGIGPGTPGTPATAPN
ncbi:MAG: Flp pilus assembly pilin Flp [Nitriliruptoraceae bacterium]|jgi:Flp pilus assembly pilin Flp